MMVDGVMRDRQGERHEPPTLRDQFAAMALAGVVPVSDIRQVQAIAQRAYAIADAMMAERKARYAGKS